MNTKRNNNKEKNKSKTYLLALLMFWGLHSSAQNAFTLAREDQNEDIKKNASFFIDNANKLPPDSLIWGKASKEFKPFSSYEGLPKNRQGSVWLKFMVNNISDHDIESFVFWGYSSKIDVYIANVSKITRVIQTGYSKESPERGYNSKIASGCLVLFRSNPSETIVLVKYEMIKQLSLDIHIAPRDQLLKERANRNMLMGLFLGILLVMMVYHLLIYFSLKDKAYLYYIAYMLAVVLTFLRSHEYLNDLLSGDVRFWVFMLMIITDNSLSITYYLFTRSFLNLKKTLPKWDKNLLWMIRIRLSIMFILLVFYFIGENTNQIVMAINLTLLPELIIFCLSFKPIYQKGGILAKFFIVGTGCFFVAGIAAVFFLALYRMSDVGAQLVQIGVVLQISVFALGFGKKMKLDEDKGQHQTKWTKSQ